MTPQDAVTLLLSSGTIITVDGDRLQIDAPEGVLTPAVRAVLSENKAMVLAMLKAKSAHLPLGVVDPTPPTPADRAQRDATLNTEIATCRAERDALAERWTKVADYLDALAARVGQDAPEFEKWFAVWRDVDAEYRRAEDPLALLELTREMRGAQ
jgi:hypothetical protein